MPRGMNATPAEEHALEDYFLTLATSVSPYGTR
jgi:hypothetical protein